MLRFMILLKNIVNLPKRIFSKVSVFSLAIDSVIDKTSAVCAGTKIRNSKLGRYSYIARFCNILNTNIGSFCSIAGNVNIGGASHPMYWLSTSPVFHNGSNTMKKNFSEHEYNPYAETNIGNDVWIGANAIIKAGINISDGAVIGMGAVVTKDVGAYEVWGGNPAKLIKKRFDDETIEKLTAIKWWNMPDDTIEKYAQYFNNVEEYIEVMEKQNK